MLPFPKHGGTEQLRHRKLQLQKKCAAIGHDTRESGLVSAVGRNRTRQKRKKQKRKVPWVGWVVDPDHTTPSLVPSQKSPEALPRTTNGRCVPIPEYLYTANNHGAYLVLRKVGTDTPTIQDESCQPVFCVCNRGHLTGWTWPTWPGIKTPTASKKPVFCLNIFQSPFPYFFFTARKDGPGSENKSDARRVSASLAHGEREGEEISRGCRSGGKPSPMIRKKDPKIKQNEIKIKRSSRTDYEPKCRLLWPPDISGSRTTILVRPAVTGMDRQGLADRKRRD